MEEPASVATLSQSHPFLPLRAEPASLETRGFLAFPIAVQGIVRGIEVEGDRLRRGPMGVEEQIDEEPFDGVAVMIDPAVAARLRLRALQPGAARTGSWRN